MSVKNNISLNHVNNPIRHRYKKYFMANHRISDIRMLELMEILKETGTIKFDADFARAAEVAKQNITQVKIGKKSFTGVQISRICAYYNINANFVHGLEKNVFRGEENSRELDRIIFRVRKAKKVKVAQES